MSTVSSLLIIVLLLSVKLSSVSVRERGINILLFFGRVLIVISDAGQVCLGQCSTPYLQNDNDTSPETEYLEKTVVTDVMSLPCCELRAARYFVIFIFCYARFDTWGFFSHCTLWLCLSNGTLHVDTDLRLCGCCM